MKKKELKNLNLWAAGFCTLAFVGLASWLYLSQTGNMQINVESLRDMEITAHRGASVDYPENTMSAFQGAVDAGADWIELDVQQTKDGMIVVAHDANLKRVAGVKKNIYDLTFDELEEIDVGSHLNKDFSSEHVPSLAEVLIFADENNIRLNIELKPNDHDFEVEESVLDLINTYYRKDMCIISSLNYDSLKRVKEIDPSMRTLYTLSLASGSIEDFEYADAFSVEASSISSRLVRRVHNAGKEIFAWTVNSEDSIYDMIELGVDNIISDEVVLARGLVLKYKSGNSIDRFVRLITELAGAR
jgi:glycerophosphoryl diester phosphodiesterase